MSLTSTVQEEPRTIPVVGREVIRSHTDGAVFGEGLKTFTTRSSAISLSWGRNWEKSQGRWTCWECCEECPEKSGLWRVNSCLCSSQMNALLFKYEYLSAVLPSFLSPSQCWGNAGSHEGFSSPWNLWESVFGLSSGAQLAVNHKWMCNFWGMQGRPKPV